MELRAWEMADIPSVAAYANNRKIADFLRDIFPFPYTPEDARRYICSCIGQGDHGQLCRAIVCDGHAVGSVAVQQGSDIACRTAELGYWLAEPYWGRGLMSAAVRSICREAFSALGLERIYATPFAENIASRRVLEHAGFEMEGVLRRSVLKNGVVRDSCMYAKLRGSEME